MKKFLGKSRKGFTLIELMIVVAIIGILAAIAIPNFIRFQLKAKTSEGKVNVAAIRTAEEAYFSEFGTYVTGTLSPSAYNGTVKTDFTDEGGFGTIGWAPEGQVYFNYEVVLSPSSGAYSASAAADIDGDSDAQAWGYIHPAAGNTTSSSATSSNGAHADCPATGIVVLSGEAVFNQVLPCDTSYGQSVF